MPKDSFPSNKIQKYYFVEIVSTFQEANWKLKTRTSWGKKLFGEGPMQLIKNHKCKDNCQVHNM